MRTYNIQDLATFNNIQMPLYLITKVQIVSNRITYLFFNNFMW